MRAGSRIITNPEPRRHDDNQEGENELFPN